MDQSARVGIGTRLQFRLQNTLQFSILAQRGIRLSGGEIQPHHFTMRHFAQPIYADGAQRILQGVIELTGILIDGDQLPEGLQTQLLQALLFRKDPLGIIAWQEFAAIEIYGSRKTLRSLRGVV